MAQATFNVRDENALREQSIPNAETVAALEEAEEMLRNPAEYKRYATFREALDEILEAALFL